MFSLLSFCVMEKLGVLVLRMKVVMFLVLVVRLVLVQIIRMLQLGLLVIYILLLLSMQWLLCFLVCSFIDIMLELVFGLFMVRVLICLLEISLGRYLVFCLVVLLWLIWLMQRLEWVLQDRLILFVVWEIFFMVIMCVRQFIFELLYCLGMVRLSRFMLLNLCYRFMGNWLVWLVFFVCGVIFLVVKLVIELCSMLIFLLRKKFRLGKLFMVLIFCCYY